MAKSRIRSLVLMTVHTHYSFCFILVSKHNSSEDIMLADVYRTRHDFLLAPRILYSKNVTVRYAKYEVVSNDSRERLYQNNSNYLLIIKVYVHLCSVSLTIDRSS